MLICVSIFLLSPLVVSANKATNISNNPFDNSGSPIRLGSSGDTRTARTSAGHRGPTDSERSEDYRLPVVPNGLAGPENPKNPESPNGHRLPGYPEGPIESGNPRDNRSLTVPEGHGGPESPESPDGHRLPGYPEGPIESGNPRDNRILTVPEGHGGPESPESPNGHRLPGYPEGPIESGSPRDNRILTVPEGHGGPESPESPDGHRLFGYPKGPIDSGSPRDNRSLTVPEGRGGSEGPEAPESLEGPKSPKGLEGPGNTKGLGGPESLRSPGFAKSHRASAVLKVPTSLGVPGGSIGFRGPEVQEDPEVNGDLEVPERSKGHRLTVSRGDLGFSEAEAKGQRVPGGHDKDGGSGRILSRPESHRNSGGPRVPGSLEHHGGTKGHGNNKGSKGLRLTGNPGGPGILRNLEVYQALEDSVGPRSPKLPEIMNIPRGRHPNGPRGGYTRGPRDTRSPGGNRGREGSPRRSVGAIVQQPVGLRVRDLGMRNKRSAASLANFGLDPLTSFGLDSVLDELTGDGNKHDAIMSQLGDVTESLSEIEADLQKIRMFIENVEHRQTLIKAMDVEHKLRVLTENYKNVIDAIRVFRPNNSEATYQRTRLKEDIRKLTKKLKDTPVLLTEFHLMITGESMVASGRPAGLACEYVESCLIDLRKASAEDYDVLQTMNKVKRYKNSLMGFQVATFQLYNTTCAEYNLTCQENLRKLDENLGKQEEQFKKCIPFLFQTTNSKGEDGYVKIAHETNHQVLYTKQFRSIIEEIPSFEKDETSDQESVRRGTPEDAGLRCPVVGAPDELWSFISVNTSGKGGYIIKQKNNCYLSYDENFIRTKTYNENFWSSVLSYWDEIDANEFLICRPEQTDAVRFLISADEAGEKSTYTLRTGGKFLNVHREKTTFKERIFVLFLEDEMSNSWKILPEDSPNIKCDNSTKTEDADSPPVLIIAPTSVVAVVAIIGVVYVAHKCGLTECCEL